MNCKECIWYYKEHCSNGESEFCTENVREDDTCKDFEEESMKIYIAGKITGLKNYKELFNKVEEQLQAKGHLVMNPAILPLGFEWIEYMTICYKMIDVCDEVYMLNNWMDSDGAVAEHYYAISKNKKVTYQEV